MAVLIPYPWTVSRNGVQTSGVINDSISDARSLKIITPRTTFRPPTPYFREVKSGRLGTYEVNAFQDYVYGSRSIETASGGMQAGYTSTLPVVDPSITGWCTNRCLSKLKSQEINLAQAFGERKQVVSLVTSNVGKLVRAARALKRLDPEGVARALGAPRRKMKHSYFKGTRKGPARLKTTDVSSFWLEMQYGWKPLLSDVHGAIEALHEVESNADRITACVTAARSTTKRYSTTPIRRFPPSGAGRMSWWYYADIEEEHRCYTRFDFVKADVPSADALTQLGLTNPLALGWELLPFSFVADWFLPVGDYLNLLDATYGWNFKAGSQSTKVTRRVSHRTNGLLVDVKNWKNHSGFVSVEGSGTHMRFDRKVFSTAPSPARPSIDTRSSVTHAMNGVALLHSILSGIGKVR